MSFEHPFDRLMQFSQGDDIQARQDRQFEDKIVGHVLARYGLQGVKAKLVKENKLTTGLSLLSFRSFNNHFPSFPFVLFAAKLPYILKDCTIDRLLRTFPRTKLFKAYEQFVIDYPNEELTADSKAGLVFHWPKIGEMGMILHNWDNHSDRELGYIRIGRFTIEPLKQFLGLLEWEPPHED